MAGELAIAIVSGAIGVGGTVAGTLFGGLLNRASAKAQLAAEDERRWLADQRASYSTFLAQAVDMLREVDTIGVQLSYDGSEPIAPEGESIIKSALPEYFERWDTDLQAALADVELIGSVNVSDLADRVSAALLEATAPIENRQAFTTYYPVWFQAKDLLGVLRNAMRSELNTRGGPLSLEPKSDDWPWLPDRPSRDSYVQKHTKQPPPS